MAMPKASTTNKSSLISMHLVAPCGPALSNHVACILNNTLYVHGGINKYMSTQPLGALYKLNLGSESPVWAEVRASGTPVLSHHACVVLEGRYLLMVGGWTGKVRSSGVTAYDTHGNNWITLTTSGLSEGAGLSSHTALLMDDGGILIVGREGSARLQRRFGNAWILRGSVATGKFTYTEQDMKLASRSGHTMHTIGNTLAIFGGRAETHMELHVGYRAPSPLNVTLNELTKLLKTSTPIAKPPCGRKQHVSASGSGLILVHGGETFDGKSRVPVGDVYVISLKPHVVWYHVGTSGVGRAGHVCCVSGERIIMHGGLGTQNTVHSDTYEIKISTS